MSEAKSFLILQKGKLQNFIKIFTKLNISKILVIVGFLFIALIMSLFTYFFSKTSFSFLKIYPEFLADMTYFILATWLFLIFLLVLGSSFVSSINIFYAQEDDSLLLSLPIKYQTIFESRFMDLIIFSSWPVIVFGIPLLLSFHHSFSLSKTSFYLSIIALIFLLLLTCILASILSMIITYISGSNGKKFVNVLSIISLPIGAFLTAKFLIPTNLVESFQKLKLEQISSYLKTLPVNSEILPSTWMVNFIYYLDTNFLFALINLSRIFLLTAMLCVTALILVKKLYFSSLNKAQAGKFIAGIQDKTFPLFKNRNFPYFSKSLKGTLLEKDLLNFFRDQTELLQAGFILFIITLYYFLLSRFPLERIGSNIPRFDWASLIKSNFLINAYILAILALRFIFTNFSMEAQSGWFVWSAPFKKSRLFLEKFDLGWDMMSIFCILSSLISTLILKQNLIFFALQTIILIIISFTLTAINLSIGAIFPNFEEKNMEKLSTSGGGLLATAVSIGYIITTNKFIFSNGFLFNKFNPDLVWFIIISFIITVVLSHISLKKIERYQF